MEEFIAQFKNNRIVRYTVLGAFLLLSYIFGGITVSVFAGVGLFLGRLSYNDVVEDIDI